MSPPLDAVARDLLAAPLPGGPARDDAACAPARLRRFRVQIFVSTWASYFGFYFCRQAFYVVKGDLTRTLGFGPELLAAIGVVYLVAYALGGFCAAALGSRTGARRLLLVGMAASLGCNVAFGFANNAWTFMAFMGLNGLAQATGWPGNVGTMANWFRRQERGQVMGVWSTCYQVGGAAAKGCAAFLLGVLGWRWSFWGASLVLGGIWLLFYFLQRNRPEDVGLPSIVDDAPPPDSSSSREPAIAAARGAFDRRLLATIFMMGGFYFFVKFVRYALWSWAPYFLQRNFGLPSDKAGYYSTLFDIFGFFGVLGAGFVSDRLFGGRRAGVALIMMIGLTLATVVLWLYGTEHLVSFAIAYSAVGFTLYGPDSLVSGAGAIDVGSRKHAILAAGIINGMGSVGSVVQEVVVGGLYLRDPTHLAPIFATLMASAGMATVLIALLVRRARLGLCNL